MTTPGAAISADSPGDSGFHQWLFRKLHSSQLVYNATWEDPRLDRELLGLGPESDVVAITSAGCNILDMLLDRPRSIHAVDVNPRQNLLLELKMALIAAGDFGDLFQFFGIGSHPGRHEVLERLRRHLRPEALAHWQEHLSLFSPRGLRPSFYWRGTSGLAASLVWVAAAGLNVRVRSLALALFEAQSLAEQQEIYEIAEPWIWRPWMERLFRHPALMSLLGVPPSQVRLIEASHPGGLSGYVRDKFRHVMTEVPARDNYFWRVYTTGSYTFDCCPNYLRREHQDSLAAHLPRVSCHTNTIAGFLRAHPGVYSHYLLLDHQDWMASKDPAGLREEWELILACSRPGTRVLLRSAGLDCSFIPAEILSRLRFHPERTEPLHRIDRVGTYGSLHLAEVI
jgi:S-adenosylmethionine-diacylglycerol 3-amino-3-carboxypropyl transferase